MKSIFETTFVDNIETAGNVLADTVPFIKGRHAEFQQDHGSINVSLAEIFLQFVNRFTFETKSALEPARTNH
ncbi:hypothetical protein DSM3645_07760 [Blastopirellula marina DSM 3645]|uniref:Uncharacterized protein n=1 Tax=Blastopirellula marina DSM 3645 TaxID=314230 RepID=A3ZXW2_9BACT|nr:hypothetical protein DSM3645_07760 [Blastopirellula marina DSM 3645]